MAQTLHIKDIHIQIKFLKSVPSSTPTTSIPSHDNMSPSDMTVATEGESQVNVQSTPEKLAPNQPVNFMITVKNKVTGQPILDATVNVNMMLMDVGSHSSIPDMSSSSEISIQGQARLVWSQLDSDRKCWRIRCTCRYFGSIPKT